MAEPTPAKTKRRVEMNSAMQALMEAKLTESLKFPNAMPAIFRSFFENLKAGGGEDKIRKCWGTQKYSTKGFYRELYKQQKIIKDSIKAY